MEFKYELVTKYSGIIPVALQFDEYVNGGYAITIYSKTEGYAEPWNTLTVWLPGLAPDEVAIDTNNNPTELQWAIDNGIVAEPHRYRSSGFCTYPICKLLITPPKV